MSLLMQHEREIAEAERQMNVFKKKSKKMKDEIAALNLQRSKKRDHIMFNTYKKFRDALVEHSQSNNYKDAMKEWYLEICKCEYPLTEEEEEEDDVVIDYISPAISFEEEVKKMEFYNDSFKCICKVNIVAICALLAYFPQQPKMAACAHCSASS